MAAIIPTSLSSLEHATSVWITIDDVKVPIYSVAIEDNKIAGVFESIEGANFMVHYVDNKVTPDIGRGIELCIDGAKVVDILYDKQDYALEDTAGPNNREKVYSGVQISPRRERPFIFKKATLTDDDNLACQDDNVLSNLGTITLKIWRCTMVPKKARKSSVPSVSVPKNNIIDEKEKKASLSHQVGYGDPVSNGTRQQLATSEYILKDPLESPLLIFELKYMARALLELNAYVKPKKLARQRYRILSPGPIQNQQLEEVDVENQSNLEDELEENRALAEAEAAIQDMKNKIAKRKADALINVGGKKIKVEEDAFGRKVKKEAGCENLGAIELLDSDDED